MLLWRFLSHFSNKKKKSSIIFKIIIILFNERLITIEFTFYLFIYITAQLDSVLTDAPNNGRQFYIKNSMNSNENSFMNNTSNNRLQCVFYEIDRKLNGLVRGSYIRLFCNFVNFSSILNFFNLTDAWVSIMLKRSYLFAIQYAVRIKQSCLGLLIVLVRQIERYLRIKIIFC